MLDSPYFDYMNNPKTAEILWTLVSVDPPIKGEGNSKPKANFQKISACRGLRSQKPCSEIHFTEIKAGLMDNPNISRRVNRARPGPVTVH